jgi:hypothetical protein
VYHHYLADHLLYLVRLQMTYKVPSDRFYIFVFFEELLDAVLTYVSCAGIYRFVYL